MLLHGGQDSPAEDGEGGAGGGEADGGEDREGEERLLLHAAAAEERLADEGEDGVVRAERDGADSRGVLGAGGGFGAGAIRPSFFESVPWRRDTDLRA